MFNRGIESPRFEDSYIFTKHKFSLSTPHSWTKLILAVCKKFVTFEHTCSYMTNLAPVSSAIETYRVSDHHEKVVGSTCIGRTGKSFPRSLCVTACLVSFSSYLGSTWIRIRFLSRWVFPSIWQQNP